MIHDLPKGLPYAPKTQITYVQKLEATSYCDHGTTAMGTSVAPGVVAVNPARSRVSLGTYLSINHRYYKITDHVPTYQRAALDIWSSSCSGSVNFGRQIVQVAIMTRHQFSQHWKEPRPRVKRLDPHYAMSEPKPFIVLGWIGIAFALVMVAIIKATADATK